MEKKQDFHTVRGYEILNQEDNKRLTSAMEDYLEMIYRGILEDNYMRINTLSNMLNIKPSSATKMVQKLTDLGLLKYEKYGVILLTDQGKAIGKYLLERHKIIEQFLKIIGNGETLLVETELIEHNVSPTTLKNIEMLNKFLLNNPDVIDRYDKFKNDNNKLNDQLA